MDSAVHIILLFSGLWALAFSASRQFYIVEEKEMTWDEAQKQCRENYTDLATIETQEEMNAVINLLNGTKKRFWIGLKQNQTCNAVKNKSAVWENNKNVSWFWSDEAPYNNSNWNDGEPNGGNEDGNNCVELYSNYTWNDAGCSQKKSFVCYKKRTPLIVIKEEMTWREALRFCRQNHMDLVSVQSEKMQDWVGVVTQNAFTNVTSRVWIGLRHTCALGFWYWVTGETICYQNWAPGNGTGVEDCGDGERTGAMLSDSKKWISLPETQKLPFICVTF